MEKITNSLKKLLSNNSAEPFQNTVTKPIKLKKLEMKDPVNNQKIRVYLFNKLPLSYVQRYILNYKNDVTNYDLCDSQYGFGLLSKTELNKHLKLKQKKHQTAEYQKKINQLNAFLQQRSPGYKVKKDDTLCCLGYGSYSTVHFGLTENNEWIAIKKAVVHEECQPMKTLSQEITIQSQCSDVAPKIFGVAKNTKIKAKKKSERIYIGMSLYKDMITLEQFLKQYATQYPLKDWLILLKTLLKHIQYLHNKNIIHNDLHTENILVKKIDDDFSIKILDFGCANKYPFNLRETDYLYAFSDLIMFIMHLKSASFLVKLRSILEEENTQHSLYLTKSQFLVNTMNDFIDDKINEIKKYIKKHYTERDNEQFQTYLEQYIEPYWTLKNIGDYNNINNPLLLTLDRLFTRFDTFESTHQNISFLIDKPLKQDNKSLKQDDEPLQQEIIIKLIPERLKQELMNKPLKQEISIKLFI